MPGFQPARSTVAARRLQDRGETGRAVFEFAEGVRTGDCEKRDREPLRPSSQTAVYRRRSLIPRLASSQTRHRVGGPGLHVLVGRVPSRGVTCYVVYRTNVLCRLRRLFGVQKDATPTSGDKHDYMSQAPYFWPNPDATHHLPYIRRDGERNAEINRFSDRRVTPWTTK